MYMLDCRMQRSLALCCLFFSLFSLILSTYSNHPPFEYNDCRLYFNASFHAHFLLSLYTIYNLPGYLTYYSDAIAYCVSCLSVRVSISLLSQFPILIIVVISSQIVLSTVIHVVHPKCTHMFTSFKFPVNI